MYTQLTRSTARPGVAGFNWNECQTSFLQGQAAMWLDGIGFAQPLEDPTKSRIVGKVGYGVHAAGAEGAGLRRCSATARASRRPQQEEGPGLVLPAVGVEQGEPDAHAAGRRRRAGAQLGLSRPAQASQRLQGRRRSGSTACWSRGKIAQPGLPVIVAGDRVPRRVRRGADQHDQRRRPGGRAEEGDRRSSSRCSTRARRPEPRGARALDRRRPASRPAPGARRRLDADRAAAAPHAVPRRRRRTLLAVRRAGARRRRRGHRVPVAVHAVHERARLEDRRRARTSSGSTTTWSSRRDQRFLESIVHTFYFTLLAVDRCR